MMKNIFYLFCLTLSVNILHSQFLPSGISTTDEKYRLGGLGVGYSFTPVFGSNKFMVNGNSFFSGRLLIGNTPDLDDNTTNWGIKMDKPFVIANDIFPLIRVYSTNSGSVGEGNFAVATGDYYFSNVSRAGDVILKAHTEGSLIISNSREGDIKFTTTPDFPTSSDQIRMIINKDGDIGIGTDTPDAKLAVNGLIHTKEVKVDLTGWPDYVFDEKYDLPSLDEVEEYIQKNGHLINVPSAEEVEEEGVKLGEMIKIQQEKIEELTLYIIELKREIEKLKNIEKK
ncbi:hypothetical protein [Flavobacterium sp. U410]